jgi:hypothetical protein
MTLPANRIVPSVRNLRSKHRPLPSCNHLPALERMRPIKLAIAFGVLVVACYAPATSNKTAVAKSAARQVRVEYVRPTNFEHLDIYETAQKAGALEYVQELLNP